THTHTCAHTPHTHTHTHTHLCTHTTHTHLCKPVRTHTHTNLPHTHPYTHTTHTHTVLKTLGPSLEGFSSNPSSFSPPLSFTSKGILPLPSSCIQFRVDYLILPFIDNRK